MMKKYQSVEKSQVVSAEGHKRIEEDLHKLGKTSAKTLAPSQRKKVLDHE